MNEKTVTKKVGPLAPTTEIPFGIELPPFDLFSSEITFDDLFPPKFLSAEFVEARGNEMTLTVEGISIEYVYDPEKGETTGEWKPCFHFREITSLLVLNKTRAETCRRITGSNRAIEWGNVGQIKLRTGADKKNRKYQILIEPVVSPPTKYTVEQINDDLFN